MKISDNGINLIKQWEGCVKNGSLHIIYNDKTGKPVNTNKPLPSGATIGYGHLIKPGEDFRNGITEAQATELLRADLAIAERAVQDNINAALLQNQFDALVSLAYNIGIKNFAPSTVVKYINNSNFISKKYPTLESAWMAWNKSCGREISGLTKRRKSEYKLFTNRGVWGY